MRLWQGSAHILGKIHAMRLCVCAIVHRARLPLTTIGFLLLSLPLRARCAFGHLKLSRERPFGTVFISKQDSHGNAMSQLNYSGPAPQETPLDDKADKRGFYDGEDVKEGEKTDSAYAFAQLVEADHQHDIPLRCVYIMSITPIKIQLHPKHRTMSWKKAMFLLFGDQVCLAIMVSSPFLGKSKKYISLKTSNRHKLGRLWCSDGFGPWCKSNTLFF